MISTLGQGLILLALVLCAVGTPLGFAAGRNRSAAGLVWSRRLAVCNFLLLAGAFLAMEYALLTNDFSVSYVAQVGSKATPIGVTIVSLWSSLEGSILLWGLILALFTVGVAWLQRRGHEDYLAYTLGTLFAISVFFNFLIAGPANPFAPTPLPIPLDGPGPNPLLQNHALMVIHPPMLYFGYVGMSVPFAMAVAALLRGQLGPTWLRPLRNWLLVPTGFLTLGVMLGGWWSYEVLGWGGYWAWDPVENASFLPWLTAIAAVHSALVQQRRGTLKAWTVILVLMTFLLTILGTFLTRSGVVNSVHSFTQSPIGPMFLVFLGVCLVATVLLLAFRIDTLASDKTDETLLAREGAFLLNNLLLVAFMFTVLIGTLFPIVAEAVRDVQVSVGEPYFNRLSVPICFGLLLLLGIGPALPWGRSSSREVVRALLLPIPAALLGLGLTWLLGGRTGSMLLTGWLAGYATWVTIDQASKPSRARVKRGEGVGGAVTQSLLRSPRRLGAYIVHAGVIITFVAIAISSLYQSSSEGTLKPGESLVVGRYTLRFDGIEVEQQPHRAVQKALLDVEVGGSSSLLEPSINHYASQMEPIGTPAVRSSLSHDLYLTLMSVRADGSAGIRAIVTPAVYWIWIGVFAMTAGTALCLFDPISKPAKLPAPAATQQSGVV